MPKATRRLSTYVGVYWDSLYQASGRDYGDGRSLISTYASIGGANLSGGLWHSHSDDGDFDPVELDITLWHTIDNFKVTVRYTHLRYPNHFRDSELRWFLKWSNLIYGADLEFRNVYSVIENGHFQWVMLSRNFSVGKSWTITPYFEFGMNQAYDSSAHDGANHITARLTASYAFTDNFGAYLYGAYNEAIGRDSNASGDRRLRNFWHTGIGLEWTY